MTNKEKAIMTYNAIQAKKNAEKYAAQIKARETLKEANAREKVAHEYEAHRNCRIKYATAWGKKKGVAN